MAPEQVTVTATSIDARTDVYALGVTLYELLTLRRPFEAPTFAELVNRILTWPVSRPRQWSRAIPKGVEKVLLCALAKNPGDRYATLAVFREDLERALGGGAVLAFGSARLSRPFAGAAAGARVNVGYEYRFPIEIFGWPLVHLVSGIDPRTGRPYVARGLVAIGSNRAIGGLAVGGIACGLVAFGGTAVGLLLAVGGAAAGGVAIGGAVLGYYACGGGAYGAHTIDGMHRDPEAVAFFDRVAPWLLDWLRVPRNS